MFLSKNDSLLRNEGIYYPVSGRIPAEGSHHNISFEIGKFFPSRPEYGTLADLINELKREQPELFILSSEMIAPLLERKEQILLLQNTIESLGYLVSYVVYIRRQESAINSIYSETIKWGSKEGFATFLNHIIAHGTWRFPHGFLYWFDYSDFISKFMEATGRDLIVRDYHAASDAGGVTKDLLSVVVPGRELNLPYDTMEWTNHKYGPHVLQALRLINDLGDWPRTQGAGADFVKRLIDQATRMDGLQGFDGLSPSDVTAIRHRFLESNTALKEKWGIDFTSGSASVPEGLAWRPIAQGALANEAALFNVMREAVSIAAGIPGTEPGPG